MILSCLCVLKRTKAFQIQKITLTERKIDNMSGKFMNVKRIVIPTLTLAIIASQLMGCAALSKSELLTLLEQGDQIEIEVASPINQEQGEEQTLDWIQLDQLQTVPELRKQMDDIFKIVPVSDTKNGVFYVDLDGNQNGNNTLYNTFMNSKFRTYWEDEITLAKVAEASLNTYVDVDFDGNDPYQAVFAAFNGYFNLLADANQGYSNPDSTLNRLEVMAALFKAEHPVTDTLAADKEFNTAVDSANKNPNTIYASNLSEQSYLDIESGSLDNMTANGTMTRGELVYMLVQQYFKAEYDSVDLKAECFADTKNGGDIASKQKFIENGEAKKYWQSYELTYALQNPDKGCPERMYKALIVAFEKEIITESNSRWDEALTKSDFMELLANAYSALPTVTNADRGTMEQLEVNLEDTTTTETNTNVDSTGVDVQLSEDEYQGTRPEDEEVSEEAVEDVADGAVEITKDRALKDAQDWLDQGLITQEEYDDMLDMIQEHFEPKPTQSAQSPTYSQQQLTPEQQAAADAMITTGQGDQRTDIQYGNAEVPDDLKGKFIGN